MLHGESHYITFNDKDLKFKAELFGEAKKMTKGQAVKFKEKEIQFESKKLRDLVSIRLEKLLKELN